MKRIMMFAAVAALGTAGAAIADHANGHSGQSAPGNTPVGTSFPEASTGDCFARVLIPATYDTVPQTVTTQESYNTISVSAAQFTPEELSVKTRDESIRYTLLQPRYEARTEDILVTPAYERLVVVPATFKTVTEQVQVSAPRMVWKPGKNLSAITRTDPDTGAVYCLVEEPGEIKTVTRRVISTPEQVRTETVPAVFKTVTKQVLVDPGGVQEQIIPAEFTTLEASRLVTPAVQSTQTVSAQTGSVDTRVLRAAERYEWAPVLCETNATTASISAIQTALRDAGDYSGPIDGIAGPSTETALVRFQMANGLPGNGLVTARTASALGLGDLVSGERQDAGIISQEGRAATRQPTATPSSSQTQPSNIEPAQTEAANEPETQTAPERRERVTRSRRLTWGGKTQ